MALHKLVLDHDAERHAKGYSSWAHFVAMLFCQLAQAESIREICGGLACCVEKNRHLGLYDFPGKSTLVGIYGMKFDYMPELGWHWAYPVLWWVMTVVVVTMVIYFRKKRWI